MLTPIADLSRVLRTPLKGFLVFEGVNGAGKSTAVKLCRSAAEQRGKTTLVTHEPGGSALGKELRNILLASDIKLDGIAETLLFSADRAQHVAGVMKPALARGEVVLCDRFFYSTLAFQGYGRGVGLEMIKNASKIAIQDLTPDLVILMDLDPKLGLERKSGGSGAAGRDRFEEEDLIFHEKIRNGFLEIAKQDPAPFVLIDASKNLDDVKRDLEVVMKSYLDKLN